MDIASTLIWGILILLLVLAIGGIVLQVFLSKRENKYLGLILPILCFLPSLVSTLNLACLPGMSAASIAGQVAMTLILGNLYTFVLLGIYFACREKIKKQRQLDKMNIQDIE
ncbi:hypothetical protein QVN85_03435 [Oscillibacter valericigenes]|nr:hypothetical protein [Oscillibacter valericigenes]